MYRLVFALVLAGTPSFADWYHGGTLHGSRLSDWKSASAANRLATSSDYAVVIMGNEKAVALGLDNLKVLAGGISDCVTEVASDENLGFMKSNEVALSCFILIMDQH